MLPLGVLNDPMKQKPDATAVKKINLPKPEQKKFDEYELRFGGNREYKRPPIK